MQTCRRSFLKQVKSSRIESSRVFATSCAREICAPGRNVACLTPLQDGVGGCWLIRELIWLRQRYIKICMFVCVYVCSGLAHLFYLMGVAWTNILPAVANLFQCQVNHSNYSNIDVPPSMSQLSSIYLFLSLSSLLHLRHAWTKGNAKLKENAIRLTKVLVFLLNKWRSLFWITLTSD